MLFTYTVGIISGPSFFASLKRGWGPMVLVVVTFVVIAFIAVAVGRLLGLTSAVIAGSFAGALNNTPALAAARAPARATRPARRSATRSRTCTASSA